MVLGIEGRSVVGNLRNVVSWSLWLAGLALFSVCDGTGLVLAQAPPAAVAVVHAPPRITEDDEKKWNSTQQIKFQNAQRAIAPTNAETQVLTEGATHLVDRMTIPKYLPNLHRNVIARIRTAVEAAGTQPASRAILLKTINSRVAELLAENPPHHPDVQLGLVLLLESLNSKVVVTPPSLVPATGSYKVLLSVLEDSNRPLQCRIHAASGVGRMGRDALVGVPGGDLSVVQRNDIAASLAKVLVSSTVQGNEVGKVWFRCRVAKALGDCGVAFDLNGGSGFIDTLMITATNPAEHLRVRAACLRATTQLSWNGTTNVPLILHETAELLLEIAQGYNAALAANKRLANADFQHANMDIYLSFMPESAHQANILKWGLLNQITRPGLGQNGPAVTTAQAAAFPVIQHIIWNPKTPVTIPAAQIAALDAWIKANAPKERKPTPVSPNAVP